tara:strand:+ start:30 stop:731 length:702 start_codon:yes stop_codon:yes gene_type:complete
MKKAIVIIILGLFLNGCGGKYEFGNRPDSKSSKNYFARGELSAKDDSKDPDIWFWGYGDTEKSAEMDFEKACMDYAKAMPKDSLLKYEKGCVLNDTKPTRKHYERLKRERRAKLQKEAYLSHIESKKKECVTIGFKPGTEKMAECILRLLEMEGNEDIAKKAREQEAWKSVLFGGILAGPGTTTSNISSGTISCIKSGETISGTNKICYYNCVGSTKTLNVGAANTCPLNARF